MSESTKTSLKKRIRSLKALWFVLFFVCGGAIGLAIIIPHMMRARS